MKLKVNRTQGDKVWKIKKWKSSNEKSQDDNERKKRDLEVN